jgi:hypothetical protein
MFLQKIWAIITLPLLFITMLTTPMGSDTETADLISSHTFASEKSILMGQGITTDGEYYYTSGSITALNFTALSKLTLDDMKMIDTNINPLPKECMKRGNNHIGGISWYNGKLYTSVEGGDEVYACIVVFDCETLEPTGEVYDLPNELYDDGVPWCAVDTETGYLYASKWNDIETIYVYDINNSMKQVDAIDLKGMEKIHRIQGGEFYNGTLYLSEDVKNNGTIKNILAVDVKTGKVTLAAERDVGADNIEAEGLTFIKDENGAVMHVLDYNRVIGIAVRHYKVDF